MDTIETVDVCVIGGSIAGNYLTYLLSRKNLEVRVIEDHREVGLPFECAGIISKKLTQLIDVPKEIILNRVKVAKIVAPSGKFIKLSGDEQPYVVDRVALDRLFYEKVKHLPNVKYYLGEKFKSFSYLQDADQRMVLVETTKRKLKAKFLAGCDGPLTSVGKFFGVKNKIIYGAQIRVEGSWDQKEAAMFFDPRWKELFGWIVPEGNNLFRVGIASARNVAKNFDTFLRLLKINVKRKIDQQGGIIPYGIMNPMAFDNALLLGDAACQVKATTGGGIVMLLTCAKYAANCVLKCFKSNDFSKERVKSYYQQPCIISVGKQLKIHFLIRTIFEHFTREDFDTFFQIVKTSKVENVISLYGDMDFPKMLLVKLLENSLVFKFLFRFIRRNPRLIVKLVRIILIH